MTHPSRLLLAAALLLGACGKSAEPEPTPVVPSGRCEVDLKASGLFSQSGSGASARKLASASEGIGGVLAQGRAGDVLLQNERIRVVVQQPNRKVGPMVGGGGIIDADIVRPAGEPGRDALGDMQLIYAFGRLPDVSKVEVLADGSSGGPAIVAATGLDVAHDVLNLKDLVTTQLGLDVQLAVDSEIPLPIRTTTYYVLSPGEPRVRVLTAYCNEGTTSVQMPLMEMVDLGGPVDFWNPKGCGGGFGNEGCLVDPQPWFGAQGDDVAYAMRSMSLADLKRPVEGNASLVYGGIVATLVDGKNFAGFSAWLDANGRNRPGSFVVEPGTPRSYLRDFMVGRDLATLTGAMAGFDGVATGTVEVTAPGPNVRIAALASTDALQTVAVSDASGKARLSLPAGSWKLSAAVRGALPGESVEVQVTAGGNATATVTLPASRKVEVSVTDASGSPVPAKVTVRCPGGTCPFTFASWKRQFELEPLGAGVAAIGHVPVSGKLTLSLPPGAYEVVVTRGPEWSAWPTTWPTAAQPLDLTTADGRIDAVLARMVDSAGWVSSDLHVHAIASADSSVSNELRIGALLAEGIDVVLTTDHESLTDDAPVIRALGAQREMASLVGSEMTSFTYGHFNGIHQTRDPLFPNGGAFDHAGGFGAPTLRLYDFFTGAKRQFPGSLVQFNHPRGSMGALTLMQVDTATLASHGAPSKYRMAAAPDATASDTKLFSDTFDAVEVANGRQLELAVVNDWMTFLSRGTVRAPTGESDVHSLFSTPSGYSRTWLHTGSDDLERFDPSAYTEAIKRADTSVGSGVFLTLTARKVGSDGQPTGPTIEQGGTLSVGADDEIELTVEAQTPGWFGFDRIELYTHAPGRESVNGVTNAEWPESRILQKREFTAAALPRETVANSGTPALQRVHARATFRVKPGKDSWFVAMARGSSSMQPLMEGTAFGMSSALLVDADGSGAYDRFPLLVSPPPPPAPPVWHPSPLLRPLRAPSIEELDRVGRALMAEHHG